MTEDTWWLVGIVAVLAAAVIGFFVGRNSGGARKRVEVLEAEVSRQKEELSDYRREVESHFDHTATLFGSLAGSYKDLFDHLSSGYEKLSGGSARQLFRGKVGGLLLGGTAVAAATGDVSGSLAADEPLTLGTEALHPEAADQSAETAEADAREAPAVADAGSTVSGDDAPVQSSETTREGETQPDGAEKPVPEAQAEAAEKALGELDRDGGEQKNAGQGDRADKA
ncbi:ZapG family protein [Accumulibacter sp.]|uniref:YhcB family protein n=1 Tax=Accumulibacter sp. TaxID=2053492 RepID=UPI0028C43694|nr:DUF1043 family protein [Accumulibacter sp.]